MRHQRRVCLWPAVQHHGLIGRHPNPPSTLCHLPVTGRVLHVIEETSGHARTFARKFCVFGRFLDLSRRNARTFPPLRLAKVPAATETSA
jgi:hypothetical protein